MILDPKNPVARNGSRLGKWVIAAGLATIVGCLSFISLRSQSVVAQEDEQIQNLRTIDSAGSLPRTAQIRQVELSVAMIRLGQEGKELTADSLHEMAKRFSENDNFAFDGGVCVVALPREQVAAAIKLLRESGDAKVLSQPKLMTLSGRDAFLADGGEVPTMRETDFGDRRIEQIEYKSLRSLRIRPEIRTQSASRPMESKAASIVRLSVTREHIEPIDALDPKSETEKTRPRMITRQLTFTADVPIGRTLLVWELKHVAEDEANLVLITPEGIHRVTREVLPNPQPLALDFEFPTAQPVPALPEVFVWPNDAQAQKQMKDALAKLRAEAAGNSTLREELQNQAARLQKQIADLTTQLRWLLSLTHREAHDQVSDAEFLRRVYLDLLGVPPSPDEMKRFVDSSDEKKREKVIDKLLEDPKVADYWARTWKDLLAGGQQAAAEPDEAKVEEKPLPPASDTSVSVFLRYMPSEQAAELLQDLLKGTPAATARIAADSRTNRVVLQGTKEATASLAQVLKLLDQPAANVAAQKRSWSDPFRAVHDSATQRQLLEIDLQEAESQLDLAKSEYAENLDVHKKSPGAVSPLDLRRKEAAVRQAELRIKRIKVLLDSHTPEQKPSPPPASANAAPPEISHRLATTIRLAEIDLREAQLKLEATSKRHQRLSELAKNNRAPQSEVDEIAIERQQAALAVERAEVVLQELKSQTAKPRK